MTVLTRLGLLAATVLFAMAALGCGGGADSTESRGGSSDSTTADSRPHFLWEGPADLHPRWEAAEVLVREAEELVRKFEGLRPANLKGRLAVLAQLELLDRSCEIGYGVLNCRRRPALLKMTKKLFESFVPPSRRHTGLSMATQVAVTRYRLALRRHESIRAKQDGAKAYFIALRDYAQCKGIPTCPHQRAGKIAARLRREVFAAR